MPGAIYSPDTHYEAMALLGPLASKALKCVDLATPGEILTYCFQKCMDLENLTIGSKVMALGSMQGINRCIVPVSIHE